MKNKRWNRIKKLSITQRANMAMRAAIRGVVIDHMRTGRPLIVWKNGRVAKEDPYEAYRRHYQRKPSTRGVLKKRFFGKAVAKNLGSIV